MPRMGRQIVLQRQVSLCHLIEDLKDMLCHATSRIALAILYLLSAEVAALKLVPFVTPWRTRPRRLQISCLFPAQAVLGGICGSEQSQQLAGRESFAPI